ncbi:MAG: D-alanyl-D-alanine carboxypeptidase, partial [Mycobacteriales bacterium]
MVRRRTGLVAATCALVLAGGATAAVQLDETTLAAPVPSVAPSPSRQPVLPAPADGASVPSTAGLQQALAAGLLDPALGGHVAISVIDAVTGRPLLESDSRDVVTPASTAKIATAVAALTVLPPERRLTTRVVAGSAPGEIVVVGGGDASLAGPLSKVSYPPAAQLSALAAQVRMVGPVTRVVVDDTLYGGPVLGPGWRPEYVTG